jgi:phage terminase small subunit
VQDFFELHVRVRKKLRQKGSDRMSVKKIKESLIQQLQLSGADVDVYRSMVDDYCWLWKQEHEMQADIRKNGRVYTTTSAAGKTYDKENPCVKNALLYSKQMVAILNALGVNPKIVDAQQDDEDEL